jgi:hypothetical protein
MLPDITEVKKINSGSFSGYSKGKGTRRNTNLKS